MDIQELMNRAAEHMRFGRLAEAEALYRQVLALRPSHAEALQFLGCIRSQMGHAAEGEEMIRRAIAMDSRHWGFFNNLGVTLLRQGKMEEAIGAFRDAISCRPDTPDPHFNLSMLLCKLGRFDEALPAFQYLTTAWPDQANFHCILGKCWLGKAMAIPVRADSAESAAQRDEALQQAAKSFERATVLKPGLDEAANGLAMAYQAMGRLQDAVAAKAKIAKRAFLVLGPESCGNRLVTQCLIAAGCDGEAGHTQKFDRPDGLVGAGSVIAWRRSLPHGPSWPDLYQLLHRLRVAGYNDVRVFALLRNHYCAVRSQVNRHEKHADTYEQAERNISGALRRIASFVLENNLPVRWITYESLVDPQQRESFVRVLKEWGLDPSHLPEFRDENEKYLGEKYLGEGIPAPAPLNV
jgi:tetratricopeptide (TPR) repeat protein